MISNTKEQEPNLEFILESRLPRPKPRNSDRYTTSQDKNFTPSSTPESSQGTRTLRARTRVPGSLKDGYPDERERTIKSLAGKEVDLKRKSKKKAKPKSPTPQPESPRAESPLTPLDSDEQSDFVIKQEELEFEEFRLSDSEKDPQFHTSPNSPDPASYQLPDSNPSSPITPRSRTISATMPDPVDRQLDPNKFVTDKTKEIIKGKRNLPQQDSKNAPTFKKNRIIDFFINMDLLFSQHEITEEAAMVELCALYAGADTRESWFIMPEYRNAKFEDFKKAILASYSKGPGDIKYTYSNLTETIRDYKEDKAESKRR